MAASRWIGGEWTLADVGGEPPLSWSADRFLDRPRYSLVNSGRVALRRAIQALGGGGRYVLLPAYGCPALTQAARDAGALPAYYPGDAQLRPDWLALGSLAERLLPRAVVIVHAFGVPQDGDEVRRVAAASGAAVIEDCSHTLCNAFDRRFLGPGSSHAAIASLRKVLPVPDGGLWALWEGTACSEGAPSRPDTFAEARGQAFALPPGPARHRALQRAEQLLDAQAPPGPLGPTAVAGLSALASAPCPLAEAWRQRCRENWSALARGLGGTPTRPLYEALEEGVCPPGYPIRHANRHLLARHLLQHGVEAALHWPIAPEARPSLSREERLLAGTILTLPCDGRLGPADMDRIVALVAASA